MIIGKIKAQARRLLYKNHEDICDYIMNDFKVIFLAYFFCTLMYI